MLSSTASTWNIALRFNGPPIADAGGPYTVVEGGSVVLDGTASSDPDGDPLAFAWAPAAGLDDPASATPTFAAADDGTHVLTLTLTDPSGAQDTDTTDVVVTNAPPAITGVAGPAGPLGVGAVAAMAATFTDPGAADTHDAVWDWGDGTTSAGVIDGGVGTVTGDHAYATPGVYGVALTITDDDGGVATAEFEFVVVFDPDGRKIVGRAKVDADPALDLGFMLKPDGGPAGNLRFEADGQLELRETAFDHLWIFTDWAHAAGTGVLGDGTAVEWLLTIVDGELSTPPGPDLFRIKVWRAGQPALVLYDSQPGAGEFDRPTTGIDTGSLKIKTG